jgi:hypothetical protein
LAAGVLARANVGPANRLLAEGRSITAGAFTTAFNGCGGKGGVSSVCNVILAPRLPADVDGEL